MSTLRTPHEVYACVFRIGLVAAVDVGGGWRVCGGSVARGSEGEVLEVGLLALLGLIDLGK